MKQWIRQITVCLLIAGMLATVSVADESPKTLPEVVSEYISEGMFEDFDPFETVPTATTLQGLDLSATAAVLMERQSGRVLYEKNPDEQRAPASITKIMTLLLTMESIESGKVLLTDGVAASSHARSMGGSQIWLEDGEVMSVDHLLKAVCVASANDAAVALAEHIAGSEEAFVMMMNQRAKQLGMQHTNFVNCCGLDAENHYTTARDIAIMSRELIAHPLITEYSTIWMDSLRDGKTELVNTNKLVRFYEGATGLKTGTTDDAGYCVSATARRGNMDLIAVVLDGATSDKRFADAKQLLNYGFANFAVAVPTPQQPLPDSLSVCLGVTDQVGLIAEEAPALLVEKGKEQQIEVKVTVARQVQAPVVAGQVVGKVTYLLENRVLGESRLLAAEGVCKRTYLFSVWQTVKSLFEI